MISLNSKLSKFLFIIIIIFFLFFFYKSNYNVVLSVTNMFLSSILPSLYPFILFSNILVLSNTLNVFKPILKKYTNIAICIVIGFLCGYPMGAKTTYKYLCENKITYTQAKFLMSFINNSNPIFILSTVGICVLNNLNLALILCASHYLSAIVIALFSITHNNIIHESKEKSNEFSKISYKVLHKNFFDILDESIRNSFIVLGNIFAFTIIFNLIFSIVEDILIRLNASMNIIYFISGLFEVTNGIKMISLNSNLSLNAQMLIISFLLGFSGLSIIFQIYSSVYHSKISILYIIKYKLLQGMLSGVITTLLMGIINHTSKVIDISIINEKIFFVIIVSILFSITYAIKKVT